MRQPIRVVLVDDHEMVLHGIEAMLSRMADEVCVVGRAVEEDSAVELVTDLVPDIVLCDVRLRHGSGLDLCARIKRAVPQTKVVFLTAYDNEQYLYQAVKVGASGYLLKHVDGRQLVRHLADVLAGETVVDSALAGRVAGTAARLSSGEFWPGARLGLTQRESEVLSHLVTGLSTRAIAGKLVVTEDTVKTHLRGVYRKLSVGDRSSAVAVALREGLFH